jgi:hypothetical protein
MKLDNDTIITCGLGLALAVAIAYRSYNKIRYQWIWDGDDAEYLDDNCRVSLEPHKGRKGFKLTVQNLSDKELSIDWDQCRYLRGGTTDGRFAGRKGKDVILPNSTAFWTLFPKNTREKSRVSYSKETPDYYRYHDVSKELGEGSHGTYLTIAQLPKKLETDADFILDGIKIPLTIKWKKEQVK